MLRANFSRSSLREAVGARSLDSGAGGGFSGPSWAPCGSCEAGDSAGAPTRANPRRSTAVSARQICQEFTDLAARALGTSARPRYRERAGLCACWRCRALSQEAADREPIGMTKYSRPLCATHAGRWAWRSGLRACSDHCRSRSHRAAQRQHATPRRPASFPTRQRRPGVRRQPAGTTPDLASLPGPPGRRPRPPSSSRPPSPWPPTAPRPSTAPMPCAPAPKPPPRRRPPRRRRRRAWPLARRRPQHAPPTADDAPPTARRAAAGRRAVRADGRAAACRRARGARRRTRRRPPPAAPGRSGTAAVRSAQPSAAAPAPRRRRRRAAPPRRAPSPPFRANTPVRGAAHGHAAARPTPHWASARPPRRRWILDQSVLVSAPIVAHYRQTASNGRRRRRCHAAVPAVPRQGRRGSRSDGAVVANLDAVSTGRPAASPP